MSIFAVVKHKIGWWRKFGSEVKSSVSNPDDLQPILNIGDLVAETSWFDRSIRRFKQHDRHGLLANLKQPRIPDDMTLRSMPHGSLGHEYYRFIKRNGLDFYKELDSVESEQVWLKERSRQFHDLIHVITGNEVAIRNEVLVNAYLFYGLRLPISTVIYIIGSVYLLVKDFNEFKIVVRESKHIRKWSKKHRLLLAEPIESWLHKPLSQIRDELQLNFVTEL